MFLIKKIKKQSGFTLMELLTSMFIIALLSGLFFTNYHGANEQNKLILAAQKLDSDIRIAQNYALGSKEFSGVAPSGGWGVYLAENSSDYIIFADINNDHTYTIGEEFRIINLSDDIITDSLNIGGFSVSSVDIVFLPPTPIIYINNVDDNTVSIILRNSKSNATKIVQVNFLGLIDIVD